ncbi:MAG: hypothetical protein ACRDTC_16270 [Pseudonocardiaceae bacterium]
MRNGCVRVVIALLLAGVAVGCTDESNEAGPPPAPANLAFVDVEATTAVSNEIAPAVARFFSYDFRNLDEHSAQIMADSTAGYWSQVEPTLEVVREIAVSRQIVISAEVVATSVDVLEPSRAELLLFVDRVTTEGEGPPQREPSSVLVTAARIGTAWKIEGMKVL